MGGGRQSRAKHCSAVGHRFCAVVISPETGEQVKASERGWREGERQ